MNTNLATNQSGTLQNLLTNACDGSIVSKSELFCALSDVEIAMLKDGELTSRDLRSVVVEIEDKKLDESFK